MYLLLEILNSVCILDHFTGMERLTPAYLMSASETVRRRSSETAVTFLYVPIPPPNKVEIKRLQGSLLPLLSNIYIVFKIYCHLKNLTLEATVLAAPPSPLVRTMLSGKGSYDPIFQEQIDIRGKFRSSEHFSRKEYHRIREELGPILI